MLQNVTKSFKYRILFSFCVSVGLIATLLDTQYGRKLISWSMRRTVMFLFNQAMFEEFYNSKCLVNNRYKPKKFNEETCELCENLEQFLVLSSENYQDLVTQSGDDAAHFEAQSVKDIDNYVSHSTGSGSLMEMIHLDIPVIYNTTETDSNTTIVRFVNDFLEIEELSWYQPCQFVSNLKHKVSEHRELMYKILRGTALSYYTLWENCADESMKAFRSLYKRPVFLENNIQLTGTNWAMICSHYNGKRWKKLEIFTPMEIVFVLTGQIELKLVPLPGCNTTCAAITHQLVHGQTAVFTSYMYELYLRPACINNETIVIGVGAYYD